MSHGRELYDRWGNLVSSPRKRSRVVDHEISESEYEDRGSDDESHDGVSDRFRDPSAYLRGFSGYDSDEAEFSSEDEDEQEEDDEQSSDEERERHERQPRKTAKPQGKKRASGGFDFATLPVLDNNGLKYLPKMVYFPAGEVCPVKPQNKVDGESLTVLVKLPNDSFRCIALPFETVEEYQNE